MEINKIKDLVITELDNAEKIHPIWPDDLIHAAAILIEEAGEVIRSALDYYNGKVSISKIRNETIQTAAMAFRLLKNLPDDEQNK